MSRYTITAYLRIYLKTDEKRTHATKVNLYKDMYEF